MKTFFKSGEARKTRLLFLPALLLLAGCSLVWSPTATVKSFITAAQKGDVDKMTQLFSSKAIQKMGLDQIRSNNQSFAELHKRAPAAAGSYRMEDVEETSTPEGKRVAFLYKNEAGTDSIGLVFDLSKEGSSWKIDKIGGPGLEENANQITSKDFELKNLTDATPSPFPSPAEKGVTTIVPAEPPRLSEKSETEVKSATSTKTISGGVLNGKAISLPKPTYPAIAKAAKASGTVVIQITIDENGNVISAHPVSGHPLLQAAATAAARAAKFTPTKLAGQPVKVNGVVTYSFAPE
jgi:TonB family protein